MNASGFALPGALTQIVPASAALPAPGENPYVGVAAESTLALASWPSTTSAFAFVAAQAQVDLVLDLRFSASAYMPGPGADYPVMNDTARVHREQVVAAYVQAHMPDVAFAIATTVATLDDADAAAAALGLAAQTYLVEASVFLTSAAALPAVTATTAAEPADTLLGIAAAYETSAGLLARANAGADAAALFGASAPVDIPKVHRVATGDTLDAIVDVLLPHGSSAEKDALIASIGTANAAMPLLAGTALIATAQSVALTDDTLATVAARIGAATAAHVLLENRKVADLFPAGTPLFWGLETYVVQPGDTLQSIADAFAVTVEDVGLRNGTLPLVAGQSLRIPFLVSSSSVASSTYRPDGTESIASVLGRYAAWSDDRAAALAAYTALNGTIAAQFVTTVPIVIGGASTTPTLASTIETLATHFGMEPVAFVTAIADTAGVLRAGALVAAPAMTASAGETLDAVAARYRTRVDDLADANASVYGLVAPGQTVTASGYAVTTGSAETFTTLAARLNAARRAAGLSPWLAARDIALANPTMTLQAATLVSPVRAATVRVPVTPRYDAAIVPIAVTVTQTRAEALVDPESAATPAVFGAVTPVAPQLASTAAVAAGDDPLVSLEPFATAFEAAFPGLKVATGPANDALDPQRAAATTDPLAKGGLWAVNLGAHGDVASRFTYRVDRGAPRFSAYPPLSTALWDSGDLAVQNYVSGVGLRGAPTISFQAVEPDGWARAFLEAFDGILAPAAATALQALPATGGVKPLDALLTMKNALAGLLRDELQPIFGDAGGGMDEARERFYQHLLVELGAAYADGVIVQYPFAVTSGCTNPEMAPRLSGTLLAAVIRTPQTGAVDVPGLAALVGVALPYFAEAIATMHALVAPGIATKRGERAYTTGNDDTLASLASIYGVTVPELVATLTIVTPGAGVLRNDAVVNLTRIRRAPGAMALSALASAMGGTVIELAAANADVADVFAAGSRVALPGYAPIDVPAVGSFAAVATALGIGLDVLAVALWNADVTQAPGAYTLTATTVLTLLAAPPPYRLTTAKIPLAAGTAYMTSIFSVKNAARGRSVFLDLRYAITAMEFDVVQDADALGAYRSSRLTFVLPLRAGDAASPNDADLGIVELPVPLRAYPEPFVLGGASQDTSTVDSISEWTYGFDAERVMAPHDEAALIARFNVPEGSAWPASRANPPQRDSLFRALARFAFVQAPLTADLALLAIPNPTPDERVRASSAVSAFLAIGQGIQHAWKTPNAMVAAFPDVGDVFTFRFQMIAHESDPSRYRYLRFDEPTGTPDFAFALPLALAPSLTPGPVGPALRAAFQQQNYGLSPSAVLAQAPLPRANAWTLADAANGRTFLLVVTANDIVVSRTWLWPTVVHAGSKAPAQEIGASSLVVIDAPVDQPLRVRLAFERIHVVGKQNAIAGMSVTRNAHLLAGRTTSEAFVYAPPLVVLTEPTTPNVVVGEPVDLRERVPGADLAVALGAFCDGVFAAQIAVAPASTRTITIEATYAYRIVPEIDTLVRVPLALIPNYAYIVGADGDAGSATSFVRRFASMVETQAAAAGIPADTGTFAFRFTVFSTLARDSGARPILRYDDLVYARTAPT